MVVASARLEVFLCLRMYIYVHVRSSAYWRIDDFNTDENWNYSKIFDGAIFKEGSWYFRKERF